MENLVVCSNKKVTLEKFMSQVKIITQNPINKILNISANSFIGEYENKADAISISGKIKVEIIYLSIDGKVELAVGESDFIEKQRFHYELNELFVNDIVSIEDINFSSNEVLCCVSHNIQIVGIYKYELPNFSTLEDEIVSNKVNFDGSSLICSAEDSFSVADESDTNLDNIEILKNNTQVVIDDVICSVDKIILEGKILCEYLYQDETDIVSNLKQIDFKQEIKAENVTPNMNATVLINLKENKVSFENNGDKKIIIYKFDIFAKSYIYEDCSYEIADDLFHLKNEINTIYDYIEIDKYNETIEQSESLLSQTNITNLEDFDDIIGVFEPKIDILNIDNNYENANVNAKINMYALYHSEKGIQKIDITENFKFDIQKENNKLVENISANCQIVSFKVKAGKEIEVVLKMNYHIDIISKISCKYVKSFEIVSEKTLDESGIKVYVTKCNQNLFDVAKALNVRPELILSQNQVDDVFETGKKVYVYSPINLL